MIRVLVVDDLFFMRTLISDLLTSDPELEVVGTAKDGEEALEKIPQLKPDCITLDLSMPGMDGLTTLQEIMRRFPTPVVILSAHESQKEADITLKCLSSGAVSFVLKPSGELSLDIEKIKPWLLQEVKAAASVEVHKIKTLLAPRKLRPPHKLAALGRIIVIGASTGGPQSLEVVLSVLPANFPCPIIVVQHVPSLFFSQSLAGRLNNRCNLEVKLAQDGEKFRAGKVYLVPFGCGQGSLDLSPSIDETLREVAMTYNGNALGIILTGIGSDGVAGMKTIKEKGGQTIVQDESALIDGMPRAVREAGYADKVLSLEEITQAMLEFVEE